MKLKPIKKPAIEILAPLATTAPNGAWAQISRQSLPRRIPPVFRV